MVYMFSRSTQMARGVSRRGAAALNSVRVHIQEVVESKHHGFVYTKYQRFICLHRWGSLTSITHGIAKQPVSYMINRKLLMKNK